jgi:uncharacterized protein (TIGR01777 family)
MKILITGGTGLIGKKLMLSLFKEGHDLVILTRNVIAARREIGIPCEFIECDLMKEIPPAEAFGDIDAVVHLAGESIAAGRWTDTQKKKIYDSRIVGTQNLVKGMRERGSKGPTLLISASAIGIYGDRGDEQLKEDSLPGKGFLAEVCREWENQSNLAAHAQTRVITLRLGVVLSSEGGALTKMLQPFSYGLGTTLGSGRQWMSWIHIDDVVSVIRYLLQKPETQGPINAVAPDLKTNGEFTKILGSVLGKSARWKAPAGVLKAALGEMSETVLSSTRVLPTRLSQLGFEFRYFQLNGALENILAEFPNQIFEASQFVARPISEVFRFFEDPKNLERMTPPWLNFRIVSQTSASIQTGTEICYRLKVHGMPMKWKTRIQDWKVNESFVDDQIQGPYSRWHHVHSFESLRGGTLIQDRVSYRLPLGGLGKLLGGSFVKNDVNMIFSYRKEKMREVFQS